MGLSKQQIEEFRTYLSQQPRSSTRKLSGSEMTRLKKSHFNQYIKKIKYYARKDLDKITQKNTKIFYKTDIAKDYLNKQQPTNIIQRPKPPLTPQKNQTSYYYFGQADLSSMKQYIFLREECHRIQTKLNQRIQRKNDKKFVNRIQQFVQKSSSNFSSSLKPLNLHLTVKSAKKIEQMMKSKKKASLHFQEIGRKSYQSIPKSFGSTNFTKSKNYSSVSLRISMKK